MKILMKALIGIGIALIAVGLAGKALTISSVASTTATIRTESGVSQESADQTKEDRKKSDTYKWIAFTGGILVIGSRIGLRIQANR
ncbi:MAG: hypothetical protein ACSHYA_18610 [Opitutaceae bacterium]